MWVLKTLLYAFLAWLLTIFFAPIINFLLDLLFFDTLPRIDNHISRGLSFLSDSWIFGYVFSLPAFIFFSFVTIILQLTNLKEQDIKFILSSLIIILIVITFYVLSLKEEGAIFAGVLYSGTSVFFIFWCKLEKREKKRNDLEIG